MVLAARIELATYWLQVSCSTCWAMPANIMATQKGLEPSTSGVTGRHSNQLSHWAIMWWAQQGSNLWPSACKADALPAELCAHIIMVTPRGIEPLLPPWKGGVLTAWPRGLSQFVSRRNRPDIEHITRNLSKCQHIFQIFFYIIFLILIKALYINGFAKTFF